MTGRDRPSSGELLFLQVISMFQVAAMQQLGKIADPTSGEVAKDLVQAKLSIDILDVLKDKTKGNLGEAEAEFLDKVLFELHMNYVDEVKIERERAESGGDDTVDGEDSGGENKEKA